MKGDWTRVEGNQITFLDTRYYHAEINKQQVFRPSVTTILEAYPKDAHFFKWLKENGENADQIRDEAGRKGSNVHHLTELYDQGEEVSILNGIAGIYSQEEWKMFERYVDFRARYPQVKILEIEQNYIGKNLDYAGTIDRVIEIDGKTGILDIKTSNAIHDSHWLQQRAYKNLFEEVHNVKIDFISILHLKTSHRTEGKGDNIQGYGWKLYIKDESVFDDLQTTWEHTQALWHHKNKNHKPKNHTYKLKHKL